MEATALRAILRPASIVATWGSTPLTAEAGGL
jgi:hypothetical protein